MEYKDMVKFLKAEIKKLEESVFVVETQLIKRNQINKEILADYQARLIKLEAEANARAEDSEEEEA